MAKTREQWLAAALEYVLDNGLASVSLRPLADALGTSPRMLLYHFESKEGLLRAILAALGEHLQSSFEQMTAANSGGAQRLPPLKRFWNWAVRADNLPYWRLHYEFHILAVRNPRAYGRYVREAALRWQALALKELSERTRAAPLPVAAATLGIAVFDGLMLELMSSGEQERVSGALDHFMGIASKSRS